MGKINHDEALLLRVASILDKLNVDYYITGGLAVSVWGRPRATFDIDIVVELVVSKLQDLISALREMSEMGYIDEITAREEVLRKGEFNFIDPERGVKIDFFVAKNDALTKEKFKRRVPQKITGQTIYFISPEDLILSKLEWYLITESTRQLEDIQSVLDLTENNEIDIPYLKKWTVVIGADEILEGLLKK